jgi:hypothetical protein
MKEDATHKTLGLVITDGVGYRNFMLSPFTAEVQQVFNHTVIFSGLPQHVFKDLDSSRFTVVELPVYREGKRQWFWRKLREIAHLRMFPDNDGILDNLKMNYRNGWRLNDLLVKMIYAWTSIAPNEKSVQRFEKYRDRSILRTDAFKSVKKILTDNPVDILFFTHQRPPFIALLTTAAKKQAIPTASFIFSWDNLASKGRMAASFDHYLVWSDLMKDELQEFYKKVQANQIHVVGTPQFEPYVLDEFKKDHDWMLRKFDLDPDKKIICYSCADQSIGPNDPIVIATIAGAIQEGKIENAQLLVRTSPAEDPSRFDDVRKKFPHIKWNYPHWKLTRENHPELWSQRIPFKEDIAELRSILEYADLSINMCSTMSLDFMLFDKPVINTVFGNLENGLYNDQRFLKYQHYKNVIDSGAVVIAKTPVQLVDQINQSLDAPQLRLDNQQRLLDLQIKQPLTGTSRRFVRTLMNIVHG